MNSVSVVVPIYYGEKYISDLIAQIEKCRESLNTEDSVEVIFVNDAPDVPISQEWSSELVKIVIINADKNSGIHGARVRGLMQCQGEYVLFLDQDDRIKPEYLYSQLLAIAGSDVVICRALNGRKEFYTDDEMFRNSVKKEFVLKAWNLIISPGQALIRRQSIPDNWIQNIMHYNGADDWLLWICMMAEESRFSLNNDILYEHVLQESNTSNDIVTMLRSEQELINIIQEKGILSDADFEMLMEGFFGKNIRRTQELYHIGNSAVKKLDILDKWRMLKERNIRYSAYLYENDVQTIAIYGYGIIGRYLYTDLKDHIDVRYFIDRDANELSGEIPVYSLQEDLPEVDGIIISLTGVTERAEKEIRAKGYNNIFILKDWIINN